jgi:hypothetical protein
MLMLFFSIINSLKIVLIFHPLPNPPLKGEEPAITPSPPEGEGKGEGDHLCLYYYETVNKITLRIMNVSLHYQYEKRVKLSVFD